MPADLAIHHVCGLDELHEAPLLSADRIVSILDRNDPSPLELYSVAAPILTLRSADIIAATDGAAPKVAQMSSGCGPALSLYFSDQTSRAGPDVSYVGARQRDPNGVKVSLFGKRGHAEPAEFAIKPKTRSFFLQKSAETATRQLAPGSWDRQQERLKNQG